MAAPRPCADGPCCAHSGAAPGARQTLDEMDFERGKLGVAEGRRASGPGSPRARLGPTRAPPLETPTDAQGGKRSPLPQCDAGTPTRSSVEEVQPWSAPTGGWSCEELTFPSRCVGPCAIDGVSVAL